MNIDELSKLREKITQIRVKLIRARDEWANLYELPITEERSKLVMDKLKEIDVLEKEENRLDKNLRKCQKRCEIEFRSKVLEPQKQDLSNTLGLLSKQADKIRELDRDSLNLGLDISTWGLIGILNSIERVNEDYAELQNSSAYL